MTGIDILVEEHRIILRFTKVLRKMCCNVLEGQEVNAGFFSECIEFGRNYADKHHHGKEERILFRIMLDRLGTPAQKMIRNGMLVEHDLGRLYLSQLEKALQNYRKGKKAEDKLDIITNACSYADLLQRHIEKEDTVAYRFALRALADEEKERIDTETASFEKAAEYSGLQKKYLGWLEKQERLFSIT